MDVLNDFFDLCIGIGNTRREERRAAFEDQIRDAMIIESSLYALTNAVTYANAEMLIDWERLVVRVNDFTWAQNIDHALYCLASTGDPKYRPVIAKYLQDTANECRWLRALPSSLSFLILKLTLRLVARLGRLVRLRHRLWRRQRRKSRALSQAM
jgi:hypothetical protein